MRRRFLPATLLAVAVLASALPASARRHHRQPANRESPSASEIADRVDARIAQLKAELRLNEDQAKNWPDVQSALHDIGVARVNRFFAHQSRIEPSNGSSEPERSGRSARRERGWRDPTAGGESNAKVSGGDETARPSEGRNRRRQTPDAMQAMRGQADNLSERANDLRKLADAASPLYASLDERQRRRFLQYLSSDLADERTMMRALPR